MRASATTDLAEKKFSDFNERLNRRLAGRTDGRTGGQQNYAYDWLTKQAENVRVFTYSVQSIEHKEFHMYLTRDSHWF